MQVLPLYPQTYCIVITNTYVTLHESVAALSTLQILGYLILIAHHEDTVIIPILQMRKLKSKRLIYTTKVQAFQLSMLLQAGFSRKQIQR